MAGCAALWVIFGPTSRLRVATESCPEYPTVQTKHCEQGHMKFTQGFDHKAFLLSPPKCIHWVDPLSLKWFHSGVAFFALLCLSLCPFSEASTTWTRTYGGPNYEIAYSLTCSIDGGYAMAGYTGPYSNHDFCIVKTDVSGNMEWSKTYGGTNREQARSLVATSDGGYAAVGTSGRTGFPGPYVGFSDIAESFDGWLIKTDALGNAQWNRTYGGPDEDYTLEVITTSDGGYAIAGLADYKEHYNPPVPPELDGGYTYTGSFWLIKTDASGNLEWNYAYGGENNVTGVDVACALIATSDGGYALAGERNNDFWLVKTNAQGQMQWNQSYGGEDLDVANSLAATADGGYVIAGCNLLVKTDSTGNQLWNKTYPDCCINSLVETSDGGYTVAGVTSSFGSADFWLTKTDAYGNTVWSQTYGGSGHDYAYDLVMTTEGGYALAGTWNYTNPTWGGLSLAIPGDFFIVKTDGLGVVPEAFSLAATALLLAAVLPIMLSNKQLFRKRQQHTK